MIGESENRTRNRAGRSFGFSSLELIIGIAVFVILASGALAVVSSLTTTVKIAREKTILNSLVAADLEIVRNLPYSDVGTLTGNPSGSLPDAPNPKNITSQGQSYQIYYEVTYLDDAADGTILSNPVDTAPNDYKQVKMFVRNVATGKLTTILTNIAPKGLEGLSNAGALIVNVFDAVGQPVANANVRIENTLLNPDIILDRTTNNSGQVIEVGLPASVNGYHIVASKTGYSSDQTYPISVGNPNPVKPDATIITGQVTQVSLAIDLVANLNIATVDEQCDPVSGVDVNVRGAKLIGTAPDVFKYNQNHVSNGSGLIPLNGIEWDTYTPTLLAGEPYTILGTSPIQQITVLPNTSQTFTFVLGSAVTNSLRVIVKDAATGAAIEGAQVYIIKGGDSSQAGTRLSGGSVWVQYDWTDGPGQGEWLDEEKYFVDDGNVDINSAPTGVRLKKVSGDYMASGWLESSAFDTGTSNNDFSIITWGPTSQNPATTLRFQIASSDDPAGPWTYLGPDGTAGTYYSVSGSSIASVHNSDRYMRYKAYFSTTDTKQTPVLTSININYVSGCATPGQVTFTEVGTPPSGPNPLTAGNNWHMEVSAPGYQTEIVDPLDLSGNIVYEVLMAP